MLVFIVLKKRNYAINLKFSFAQFFKHSFNNWWMNCLTFLKLVSLFLSFEAFA